MALNPFPTNTQAEELRDVERIPDSDLGCGLTGTVGKGWWQGTMVAVKRLRASYASRGNDKMVQRMISKLRKEGALLCGLRHPHVVQFFGLTPDDELVMELLDISLHDRLHGKEREWPPAPLNAQQQVETMLGTSAGLQYLHSKSLLHRDLSSNNILLQELSGDRLLAKVSDYGSSIHVDPNNQLTHMSGGHGRMPYLAPEVMRRSGHPSLREDRETKKSDVWSLGVLTMEVALTIPPEVLPDSRNQNKDLLYQRDHVFYTFVPACLEDRQAKRPEAQEVSLQLRKLLKAAERKRVEAELTEKRLQGPPSEPSPVLPGHETTDAAACTEPSVEISPMMVSTSGRQFEIDLGSSQKNAYKLRAAARGEDAAKDGVENMEVDFVASQPQKESPAFQKMLSPMPLAMPLSPIGQPLLSPPATGQCPIPEEIFLQIAEYFSDVWQCERLAVSLKLQKGSQFVKPLQGKMEVDAIAFHVFMQWADEYKSKATGSSLYNTLVKRLQLKSVAESVHESLIAADEAMLNGFPTRETKPPSFHDTGPDVLTEEVLLNVAAGFTSIVRCKRLSIHLGIGAGTVDRLLSFPGNGGDPTAVAFQVLKKYTNAKGAGQAAAEYLYSVLDDQAKLGMRRTAQGSLGNLMPTAPKSA